MRTSAKYLAAAAVASIAVASASAANATQVLWFYGTGDSAGGVFRTDGAGNITSGNGIFNTSLGTLTGTISPGSGSEASFIWDNRFPINIYGALFRTPGNTYEINLFDNFGAAGLGVTPNIALDFAPPNVGVYPVVDNGTLTISALGTNTYEWFYGTGDSAGGVFNLDGAGNIVSGNGIFNTSLGTLTGTISPGSGSEASFIWDNRFPINIYGALFRTPGNTYEINLFDNFGAAGLGVTPNIALDFAPPNVGFYPVVDNGTLTVMGVPEPATWALMIGGFGLAGAALRRRRAALAAA